MIRTLVRRLLKMAVVAGVTAIVVTWFRNREPEILDPPTPGSAKWAPLDTDQTPDTAPAERAAEHAALVSEPTDGAAADPARGSEDSWVEPDSEGDCPLSHPVKAKVRSGIYHVPEGLAYERTNADRCYASPDDAEADGYRASKM